MNRLPLNFERLEHREVPALLATGADAGGGPHVRAFDAATGEERYSFLAYDPAFTGGVRVACGDITGDGQDDIVTAAGTGGGPHVRAFDGATGALIREFMAYDPAFRGGVYVAIADVNGDGTGDIITGPGVGGGPHVQVFGGTDNAVLRSFYAFPRFGPTPDAAFYTGATVAGGDMDGDGFAEIVAGSGPGRYSQALAFDGETGEVRVDLQPIFGGYFGGVFVALGDLDGDGNADLALSLGSGQRTGEFTNTVFVTAFGGFPTNNIGGISAAYDLNFHGGVRIALVDTDGDGTDEIVTAPGPGGGPQVRTFANFGQESVRDFIAYDAAFTGGVFVG